MRTAWLRISVSSVLGIAACVACNDAKKSPEPAASAAPAPTPVAPPPEPEHKEPPKSSRPEKIDIELTPERRTKAEAAMPEAKGFLVATELEEKLKANKKLKEKEAGVAAFDKMAAGKWVLFTGPIANLTESGFDVGITYTPQIKGDVMGMSRQWFPVTFSNVKGYEQSKFKVGNVAVVLAKYTGKQKAGPGEELVDAAAW
jgi:hypothetical protein